MGFALVFMGIWMMAGTLRCFYTFLDVILLFFWKKLAFVLFCDALLAVALPSFGKILAVF